MIDHMGFMGSITLLELGFTASFLLGSSSPNQIFSQVFGNHWFSWVLLPVPSRCPLQEQSCFVISHRSFDHCLLSFLPYFLFP
ncbi:hypothetical protein C8J56DRAFT_344247 [Mycena floridula]|nr:hypothetical protein C8J56DRAFT_344247 [Mycena floridula]